jgi:hypothetical protein
MGTALAVSPFNFVVNMVEKDCPKVLINMENTAANGFDFVNEEAFPERLFLQGKCDETI